MVSLPRLLEPNAFDVPGPQALTLRHRETGSFAERRGSSVSPARLKVIQKEQQPARSDHAVGLSQRGFAVVHVADGQGADHGVECVVAEREPATVGDSHADRPTALMGTLRRDFESLAVEIYRHQFDVAPRTTGG